MWLLGVYWSFLGVLGLFGYLTAKYRRYPVSNLEHEV
jgi:hypothetical protein